MTHPLIEPLEARIAPATLSIDSISVTEGDSGFVTAKFTVTLDAASGADVTVNYATADGTAKAGDADYNAASGTLTFSPGDPLTKEISISVPGDARNELDETFFVNLTNAQNATLGTAQGTATIQDNDPEPILKISSPPTLTEGNGSSVLATFTVSLINLNGGAAPSGQTVTVDYATADGSALVSDADYTAKAGTLSFAPGETSKVVTVSVTGDTEPEGTENFFLNLTNPLHATLPGASPLQGTATIADNDAVPTLTLGDVTIVEGNSGTKQAIFTTTLSGATGPVTVNYQTQDGTADSTGVGADFTAIDTTALTFAAGETSKTVAVTIAGDQIFEGPENFKLLFSGLQGATFANGKAEAVGTITDDETAPTLSIANKTIIEGQSGTTQAIFTVTLTGPATQSPVTVKYQTADVSATVGDNDYEAIPLSTFTFAPGQTTKTVAVTINGDTKGEADEIFQVQLSAPQNATLATTSANGTITNDDAALSIGNVTIVEGDSGTKQAIFTVTLANGPASGNVTVNYASADNSATVADGDYTAVSGALTFAPGETTKTIAVPVFGDTKAEGTQSFFVNLSGPSANAGLAKAQGVGTINDDEPTLSIGNATLAEGHSGTTDALFTVTLSGARTVPVTVQYQTNDGTAKTANSDYLALALSTLTFAPGETSKTIAVPILGDLTNELNESFTVVLQNATNTNLGTTTGTGTITNDDAVPTLSIGNKSVTEGDSGLKTVSFTVSLSQASGQEVRVTAATQNDTAISGTDYLAKTGLLAETLIFAPGETTKTFQVQITGDNDGEADETFFAKLSNPLNATLADDTGTGTIVNDDAALSIGDVTITEGDSGTKVATFKVQLAQGGSAPVTVNFASSDGSAVSTGTGKDYDPVNGTLTFQPGQVEKTISVTISGDTTIEPDETFFLDLSNAQGAALVKTRGTGTIQTDETQLLVSNATITEGDSGTKNAIFTVRRTGSLGSVSTISFATADDTATVAAGDYLATMGTVTFAAGESFKTVQVPVVGDGQAEGTEQFFLKLSGATNGSITGADAAGVKQVSGTITDNNANPVLNIGNVTLAEGNSGTSQATFTVSLSTASSQPITVNYATADGSATTGGNDYTAASGTLTFAPGETTKTIPVAIKGDGTDEVDETFAVNLTSPSNATVGNAQATATILNDDRTLSISSPTIAEGDAGLSTLSYVVTLNQASTHAVTVNYATQDGTATVADGDYTAKQGTLTFAAGETSNTVTVSVRGDLQDEANETVLLLLSGAQDATTAAGTGTGTIQNDDAPALSIGDVTIAEGDSGTKNAIFTVTLSKAGAQPVTVSYGTSDGTAKAADLDYTVTGGRLTFAPGETSKTLSVPVVGDTKAESDETFKVLLSDAINATVDDGQGVATIQDGRTVSIGSVTQAEGNSGSSVFTFTVSLDAAAEQAVSVDYQTADGTAVSSGANADFVSKAGTVTFAAGEKTKTVQVTVNGDTRAEADERFSVLLSNPVNATLASSSGSVGTGTIRNDESTLSFAAPTVTVVEGDPGTGSATMAIFEVRRTDTGNATLPVTVHYATADGSGANGAGSGGARPDFTAVSGDLTFAAGETVKQIAVPITKDFNQENNESFTLKLSTPVNASIVGDTATGTITDNDPLPAVTIGNVTVAEGDSGTRTATFTVTLNGANETGTAKVDFATLDGTAISTGTHADFVAQTGTLTFAAGETSKTVVVTINGDTVAEGSSENFSVKLSNPQNATLATTTGVGTITDEEISSKISFTGGVSLVEGNTGTSTATFNLHLSAASEQPVTVHFQTANGTALAGSDYVTTSGTRTFAPYQTDLTVPVTINGDLTHEKDEQFTLTLDTPTNAQISAASATATIQNDDAQPALSLGNVSIAEGNSGTKVLTFTATLLGATAEVVTVNYATADGTALSTGSAADFVAKSGTLSFAPGEAEKTFQVTVNGDTFKEGNENFTVTLSNPVNATVADATATGTILEDGDTGIALQIKDARVVEGNNPNSPRIASFTVQLSSAAAGPVTFTAATRNGTAVQGADFTSLSQTFTIPAGMTSITVPVKIMGDATFESTESFFLDLTNVSGATALDAEGSGRVAATARATIFNDDVSQTGNTLHWSDEDGDLVTLKVSKGLLVLGTNVILSDVGSVGGKQLTRLDLTGSGQFARANVTVTAERPAGLPEDLVTDGRVDVGWIRAASFLDSEFQIIGIDLGTVKVDGDLAKVTAGDPFSTPAIGKLDVYSLGGRGTATGAPDAQSDILGPITSVLVTQNVAGYLHVIGAEFGRIGTLKVGGALLGGGTENSGQVSVTGSVGSATIGRIVGGDGDNSGRLNGDFNTGGRLGKVKVLGDVVGGGGKDSGEVSAPSIGSFSGVNVIGADGVQSGTVLATRSLGAVTLSGDLVGGSVNNTGEIFSGANLGSVKIAGSIIGGSASEAGSVIAGGGITSVSVGGALVGSSGDSSGVIQAKGGGVGAISIGKNAAGDSIVGGSGINAGGIGVTLNLASLSTAGNIRGGTKTNTGSVDVRGNLGKLTIGDSLIGGTSTSALSKSGYIQVLGTLKTATVVGDIVAGVKGSAGLANSGAIRTGLLGALSVQGNLLGSALNPVVISATGLVSDLAIKSLVVGGRVEFAEILAGYGGDADTNGNFRGNALSADAQLGALTFNGPSVLGLDIVAGAVAGGDGRFGTADDAGSTGGRNNPGVISKIASVIIKGTILANAQSTGIVAQNIVSVKLGAVGTALALLPGAGDDLATSASDPAPGLELSPASRFRALELPI